MLWSTLRILSSLYTRCPESYHCTAKRMTGSGVEGEEEEEGKEEGKVEGKEGEEDNKYGLVGGAGNAPTHHRLFVPRILTLASV